MALFGIVRSGGDHGYDGDNNDDEYDADARRGRSLSPAQNSPTPTPVSTPNAPCRMLSLPSLSTVSTGYSPIHSPKALSTPPLSPLSPLSLPPRIRRQLTPTGSSWCTRSRSPSPLVHSRNASPHMRPLALAPDDATTANHQLLMSTFSPSSASSHSVCEDDVPSPITTVSQVQPSPIPWTSNCTCANSPNHCWNTCDCPFVSTCNCMHARIRSAIFNFERF